MKDYTALLLNCYIKQKKTKQLKEFVDDKNFEENMIDVDTAIEVCKDTDQIDLAISIAQKSNRTALYLQLIIDYKRRKLSRKLRPCH